uniref:Uncharacterized protein n=1 Tax=Strigamia maritima TaxID=126957 RepID=T1J972_STRMM
MDSDPLHIEIKLLLGKSENKSHENGDDLETLTSAFIEGNYEDCITSELLSGLWKNELFAKSDTLEEHVCNCVDSFVRNGEDKTSRELIVLIYGASALQLFVQANWTGPTLSTTLDDNLKSFITEVIEKTDFIPQNNFKKAFYDQAVKFLSVDGALYPKINLPEYLWLARVLLCSNLNSIVTSQTFFWWALRCTQMHQMMLDEKSPTLRSEAIFCIDKGMLNESVVANDKYRRLQIEFNLECSSVFLCYFDSKKSEEHLNRALQIAGLDVCLTGALGKRTYFQETAKAQLKLNIKRTFPEENIYAYSMELPKDILINDGTRREKISFSNEDDNIQKTNPVHRLLNEELMAYLNVAMSHPKIWSVQTKALFLRSQLEAKHNKSAERSMMQIQELVNAFHKPDPSLGDRLHLFYSVSLSPIWKLENKLADLLLKLGAVSSALEIYLRLEVWDKMISCYQLLERKSQAEEILRNQLLANETPNLWCTLGDVIDDLECYERAWILSNGRSARAQRCFGQNYFSKKEYEQCIPYLKKSLELNHLQLGVSSNLGYAAMQIEDWETAASAYRRCLNLEPDLIKQYLLQNFQAWNNIANVYLKLNQKPRAWKSLQEALRCDFDNWRIWENYMVVSVDCRAFDEGIAAYHRLLELKEKHVDIEILALLANAVVEDLSGNDESLSSKLKPKLLQLFGRLTSQVTSNSRVWDLYANVVSANCEMDETILEKVIQFRQRAQRIASQQKSWERSEGSCEEVIDVTLRLADDHLSYWAIASEEKKRQTMISAKLMLRGISSKLKNCQATNLTLDAAPYLIPLIEKVDF